MSYSFSTIATTVVDSMVSTLATRSQPNATSDFVDHPPLSFPAPSATSTSTNEFGASDYDYQVILWLIGISLAMVVIICGMITCRAVQKSRQSTQRVELNWWGRNDSRSWIGGPVIEQGLHSRPEAFPQPRQAGMGIAQAARRLRQQIRDRHGGANPSAENTSSNEGYELSERGAGGEVGGTASRLPPPTYGELEFGVRQPGDPANVGSSRSSSRSDGSTVKDRGVDGPL